MLGNEVQVDAGANLGSFLTRRGRSEQIAKIMIALLLPAAQAANNAYRRGECALNLKRIVWPY